MSLEVGDTKTSGYHSVLTDTYVGQLENEREAESSALLPDGGPGDGTYHGSFTAVEIFKSRAARLWSRFVHCKYSKRKIPTDRPVTAVLFLCFLQRLAYTSLTLTLPPMYNELKIDESNFFITSFVEHCLAHLMFPLAGWAGDVYLGRVKAIHASLLLLFVGYGAMTLECALYYQYDCMTEDCMSLGAIMMLTYLMTTVGEALFHSNAIPYGADLILHECSSTQVGSYFYWYYWVRSLGGPLRLLLILCGFGVNQQLIYVISSAIATLSITVALLFLVATRSHLPNEKIKTNPYTTSVKILFYVARAKRPKSKSAFGFGKSPPPRIDLAKWRHGGKFDNEQVEDVKTICRLSLLLVAITAFFTSLTMVSTSYINTYTLSMLIMFFFCCGLSESRCHNDTVLTLQTIIP